MFDWIYKGSDAAIDQFLRRKLGTPYVLVRQRQLLSELRKLNHLALNSNRRFNRALTALNVYGIRKEEGLSHRIVMRVFKLKAKGLEIGLSKTGMLAQLADPTLRGVIESD